MSRAIEIQISARVRKPKGTTITGKLLRDAVLYRIEHGQDPPGIRIRITSWTKNGNTTNASGQAQDDIWEKFGPLLRARFLDSKPIRARSRTTQQNVNFL